MTAIYTPLKTDEAKALVSLALKEKRTPREQAALIIRHELERLGYLPPQPKQPQQSPVMILEATYERR